MRILVVEDDEATAVALTRGLVTEGYTVDVARSGEQAIALASAIHDAVVLDLMLPGPLDGFDVCRRLRQAEFWGAIVMLTARTGVPDRVAGLDAGADDYLGKPFTVAELTARLRAQTRRSREPRPTLLAHGELRIDPASQRCWRGAVEVDLSRREFGLLREFLRHPGQVLTREVLLGRIWEEPEAMESNVVDQTVRYLRRKLDLPFGRHDIQTVRGLGYRLGGSHPTSDRA